MGTNEFTKSAVFSFNSSVEYSSGAIVSKTVLKKDTGNISLFAFDRGETLSEHTASFDALIEIVDGRSEVTIGGKPFILNAGESILLPANVPHSVKAVERFKMVLTMIRSS